MSEYTLKQQPTVYPVDATKAKSLEEIGVLFNALGIAMTKEYAKEKGLEHLLDTTKGEGPISSLDLPKLK